MEREGKKEDCFITTRNVANYEHDNTRTVFKTSNTVYKIIVFNCIQNSLYVHTFLSRDKCDSPHNEFRWIKDFS